MITIDARSTVPIYEQIKAGFRGMVARGLLGAGDQVPAIRSLAEILVVNPNTIARAYRELILEGFLESRKGEGNYVSAHAKSAVNNGMEDVRHQFREAVKVARRGGLSWKDLQAAIQQSKEEEV